MIVRVAAQANLSGAANVIVATDDSRVLDAVQAAGMRAAMTREDHESGSDRVMEVAQAEGWDDADVVINVQGDEPLIPPEVIAQVASLLADQSECDLATLCEPILDPLLLFDPNVVKVVRGAGLGLYFSRAPIPWDRSSFSQQPPPGLASANWWRHIGIYAFRVGSLRRFCDLPTGNLEALESLEQLRALENGMSIAVAESCEPVPGGVDTPEDLDRVNETLR